MREYFDLNSFGWGDGLIGVQRPGGNGTAFSVMLGSHGSNVFADLVVDAIYSREFNKLKNFRRGV